MTYKKDYTGPGPWRLEEEAIMRELDKRICIQMNICSPEKTERGCAMCADMADDVIETYFRLKVAMIDYRDPPSNKSEDRK